MSCSSAVRSVGVAEEAGHADQQVAKQQHHLLAVGLQQRGHNRHIWSAAGHLHPPLHPPHEGLLLVLAEIMTEAGTQDVADR